MLGKHRIKEDIRARTGTTVFTAPAGSEIEVRQIDREFSKVLINFGDGYVDWFHESWLAEHAEPQNK